MLRGRQCCLHFEKNTCFLLGSHTVLTAKELLRSDIICSFLLWEQELFPWEFFQASLHIVRYWQWVPHAKLPSFCLPLNRFLGWVFQPQLGKAFPCGKHSFYQGKGKNTKTDSYRSLAPVIISLGPETGEHPREFPVLMTLHIWSPEDPSRKRFPNLGWGSLLLKSNFPPLQDYRTLKMDEHLVNAILNLAYKPGGETFFASCCSEVNKAFFWELLCNKNYYITYVFHILDAGFHSVLEPCDDRHGY